MPRSTPQAALLKASTPVPISLFCDLITANHILHQQHVLDGFGHISVRNAQDPAKFFLSRSLAPALVASREDIEEYLVEDGSPVNKDAPKAYVERFIHSEVYKKYAEVNSVVHSHSEAVIPFSITSIPLRPVYHMASFLSPQAPVYDISLHYKSSSDAHTLLVTSSHLGATLATGLHPNTLVSKTTSMIKNYITSSATPATPYPSSSVILMRGHGFTAVGKGIDDAVFKAVYTCVNAKIQAQAALMQGSFNLGFVGERFGAGEAERGPAKREEVKYLNDREGKEAWASLEGSVERAWGGWCREVEVEGLYRNEMLEVEEDEEGDDGGYVADLDDTERE
ncbi:hypothetical protein B0A48_15251 [Cryoendolithus antarcticus]|uniref:Class II aldolase/adducin N-terminal domain-containing protein n=1 Tax=Cryoendolithus antarcticus TaxID=1507870 RepID=A0A1V8SID4_9PEZI|nr:hypothetical protein B0A48_15251 [Cryoendolithus antarcticus]